MPGADRRGAGSLEEGPRKRGRARPPPSSCPLPFRGLRARRGRGQRVNPTRPGLPGSSGAGLQGAPLAGPWPRARRRGRVAGAEAGSAPRPRKVRGAGRLVLAHGLVTALSHLSPPSPLSVGSSGRRGHGRCRGAPLLAGGLHLPARSSGWEGELVSPAWPRGGFGKFSTTRRTEAEEARACCQAGTTRKHQKRRQPAAPPASPAVTPFLDPAGPVPGAGENWQSRRPPGGLRAATRGKRAPCGVVGNRRRGHDPRGTEPRPRRARGWGEVQGPCRCSRGALGPRVP